jgi:hypothetical protein
MESVGWVSRSQEPPLAPIIQSTPPRGLFIFIFLYPGRPKEYVHVRGPV